MACPLCYTAVPKGFGPLVSVWIADGKTQKQQQKIFKSQHRKTKCIYIYKKCPKNKSIEWKILNKWDGHCWQVNIIFFLIISHHLSLFFSPAASSWASSSSSVSLVHVHNVKMECQNKSKKQNKQNKINRCCRCCGDGWQIHGRVWEGIQRP